MVTLLRKSRVCILFISLFLAGVLASCSSTNKSKIDLSANEAQKETVFNQIMNNPQLMNEFMDEMMQNPGAMHYMMENESFMHHMLTDENLEYMMEHNHRFQRETMPHMMDHFRSDTSMHYDETMHDGGMMD